MGACAWPVPILGAVLVEWSNLPSTEYVCICLHMFAYVDLRPKSCGMHVCIWHMSVTVYETVCVQNILNKDGLTRSHSNASMQIQNLSRGHRPP